MIGALFVDSCEQTSFVVENGKAFNFSDGEVHSSRYHISNEFAPPFMSFPWIFDTGYLIKVSEFGIDSLPKLDLDVILVSFEKEQYDINKIKKQYPNSIIVSVFKEHNPLSLDIQPQTKWNDNTIHFMNNSDYCTFPFEGSLPNEFLKLINKKVEYLPDPCDVDYLYEKYYKQNRTNSVLLYLSPTHHDRGQVESLRFCEMIENNFGVEIVKPNYSYPYNHSRRIPFTEFVEYISNTSFSVNMDKWVMIGQFPIICGSLGNIHIGGLSGGSENIWKSTKGNDMNKLLSEFERLYKDINYRVECIQNSFERTSQTYGLKSVRNRLEKIIGV